MNTENSPLDPLEKGDVEKLENRIESLEKMLQEAVCPCCEGVGSYYDDFGNYCDCLWCDELGKLLERQEAMK